MSPCWCKWRDDQQGVGAQTSCTENLQIIYTNILFLKEVEHNFPSFKLGLCLVTRFQRPKYRKGGSKKWPGKHDLHQLTEVKRLTQQWWVMLTVCTLDMSRTLHQRALSPQVHKPTLIMRKISGNPEEKDTLQNFISLIPQNCQGHQNQRKSKKLSSSRGAHRDMMTKCDLTSWIGSCNREREVGNT